MRRAPYSSVGRATDFLIRRSQVRALVGGHDGGGSTVGESRPFSSDRPWLSGGVTYRERHERFDAAACGQRWTRSAPPASTGRPAGM